MIQIPADLGQRILDAARIAAAMHEQSQAHSGRDTIANAGGAGRSVVIDHDGGSTSTDGSLAPRLSRGWSRLR